MKHFLLLLVFVVGLLLATHAQPKKAYVILISFDGFRYDYVAKYNPPNFKKFISNGSQAEGLIPSFPSKTFPNHYTLVTGLVPGNHGLVDNSFYDRERNVIYRMKDTNKVVDPYYYGGIPIWQLAQQHGLKSASYFWVGSEMNVASRRPDYFFPFNDHVPPQERIEQTLNWLRLPESERPQIITTYFSFPDHEGHLFGPNSEETRRAVLRADSLLGSLMEGLKSISLPVNVVVVSDHGMSELTVSEETSIFLNEFLNTKDTSMVLVGGYTHAYLYFKNAKNIDSVYQHLKATAKNYKVYRKKDFPAGWNLTTDRAGDIVIAADPGFYIREGDRADFGNRAPIGKKYGGHGYDPLRVPDMKGIFYAQGPNIKPGLLIPEFQNIHVYPLLAKILNLPLPRIDGDEKVLIDLYQK